MDLFTALLVTHTFHAEFAVDRQRALRMAEERPESAPVAAAQPVERQSAVGVFMQHVLNTLRNVLHTPTSLPRPH